MLVDAFSLRARGRLAFAVDVQDLASARQWFARLGGEVGVFKIGLELFSRVGAEAVLAAREGGSRVFLDLKLHDIPETVGRAIRSAADHQVDYVTVHATGGSEMLRAAARAAATSEHRVRVLAVTVLTSLTDADLEAIGMAGPVGDAVSRLALLAADSGIDGFVCSPLELPRLRRAFPHAFLATPGIRMTGDAPGDQMRVASPADAIRNGADMIVVGRPIRDAADPITVARAVVAEIASATA